MSKETLKIIVTCHDNKNFRLIKPYEYNYNGIYVKIPKGFVFSGVYSPRILWSILPPNDPKYLSAILVHKYLCYGDKSEEEYLLADNVLKNTMIKIGCNKFKANLLYICYRVYRKIFIWSNLHYKKHNKEK